MISENFFIEKILNLKQEEEEVEDGKGNCYFFTFDFCKINPVNSYLGSRTTFLGPLEKTPTVRLWVTRTFVKSEQLSVLPEGRDSTVIFASPSIDLPVLEN